MKLLFDLNALRPPRTGIGYYTQHLLQGLRARSDITDVRGWMGGDIYSGERLDELVRDQAPSGDPVLVPHSQALSLSQCLQRSAALQPLRTFFHRRSSRAVRAQSAKEGYVYHETNFAASRYAGPTVATIHDLSHRRHPEFHSKILVQHLDRELPRTFRRVNMVIADSHYTKQEIVDLYDVPEERVTTIHLGVDECFRPLSEVACRAVLSTLDLRQRAFVLSVGTLQPRKNLLRLVEAFAALPRELRREFPLVLIGARGWKTTELASTIAPFISAGEVVTPGYLSRNDLLKLFASAAVFAYPSLYEGFGLPVLEAMASGTAVLTSAASSLPEVSGGAAVEVDPWRIDAIEDGLRRLLTDASLRRQCIERGVAQASKFTWASTIEQTCAVYKKIC
ncbi:glycosyltransferase family 1 protein [Paraburkholderia sp. MPAMCS5]|uniref:glycosyltransferase family 4 protein n=1 Tax=Paraburkholderia sp. MPAMCS5 TaxID=3112563 RepID=UPI002E1779CF|nr:glycosyltransferase family 1 protein [Paraburkholderia sp. MPAMCS5]